MKNFNNPEPPPGFFPLTLVELQQSETTWPFKRAQKWYWVQKSVGNGKALSRSVEMFTNRQDALKNAFLCHSANTTVYLVEEEGGETLLRQGQEINQTNTTETSN